MEQLRNIIRGIVNEEVTLTPQANGLIFFIKSSDEMQDFASDEPNKEKVFKQALFQYRRKFGEDLCKNADEETVFYDFMANYKGPEPRTIIRKVFGLADSQYVKLISKNGENDLTLKVDDRFVPSAERLASNMGYRLDTKERSDGYHVMRLTK